MISAASLPEKRRNAVNGKSGAQRSSLQGRGELCIVLEASSFLRQMPRLIAGTLLDIGLGLKRAECIPAILSGQEPAGAPAPALGLCLTGTRYA